MSDLIRRRVVVSGRVQGVFFRQTTKQRALELGLLGWVRNRADGTLEAVFQGRSAAVADMLSWCHQGPPGARVAAVDISEEPLEEPFPRFSVRRTE